MDTSYYQSIVNALPHSALIIDSNLNILSANGHAEKLFDRDLSGVGFVRVLRQPEALQCVSGALDSGEYRSCNLILRLNTACLLYTSPSPRDATLSRMPSSA